MRTPVAGLALILLGITSPILAGKGDKSHPATHASKTPNAPRPPGPLKKPHIAPNAHYEPHYLAGAVGGGVYHPSTQHNWGTHRWYPGRRHDSHSTHTTRPNGWQAARLKHLNALKADIDRVGVGAVIGSNHTTPLHRDLHAVAQGGVRVPDAPVRQLTDDLAGGLSRRHQGGVNSRQLTLDLEEVMNHAHLPISEVNQAITRARSTLMASGVSRDDAGAIARDLHAIASGRASVPALAAGAMR